MKKKHILYIIICCSLVIICLIVLPLFIFYERMEITTLHSINTNTVDETVYSTEEQFNERSIEGKY